MDGLDIWSGFGAYIFLQPICQALDFIPKHCKLFFSLWSMFFGELWLNIKMC